MPLIRYQYPTYFSNVGNLEDPANTIFVLYGETMADSSSVPTALTVLGNTTISSAQFRYGSNSIYFDGTGDYIKANDVSRFIFGSNDFTIEAWVYPTIVTGKNRPIFCISQNLVGGFAYMYVGMVSNGNVYTFQQPTTGGGTSQMQSSDPLTVNVWSHIAMVRQGSTVRTYVNGVLSTTINTWVDYPGANTQHVAVGAFANGYTDSSAGSWEGYIDELRVSIGIARYTANFTPGPLP